ncbi:U5 small nuclear ribonucleoprotein component [Chloropicon roscoffensis]|uniref:SNU114 homolog n=1 Tax=Chloropicon roscoffensis TaxID=1461544 RepID=A0AAX4PAE9_9CHLO
MEDDDLYDEFGNYIGPPLSDGSSGDEGFSEENVHDAEMAEAEARANERLMEGEADDLADEPGQHIVLHEDKKYYPSADEVYGGDVETLVEEEDAQPLEEALVKSVATKVWQIQEKSVPVTTVSQDFLAGLMSNPELIRNVSIVGHLHHGKTSVVDMFVEQTHSLGSQQSGLRERGEGKPLRYTDYRLDEQKRGISIKATPMSLVLQGMSGKSYLCNVMDTPGHVNFADELVASLRLSDGILLVVDAAEGLMITTEIAIKAAVAEGLAITLLVNKMDRLIVELKLPPSDAYYKLRHMIEEVNDFIRSVPGGEEYPSLSPAKGNVAFGSSLSGWSFTLPSFAKLYSEVHDIFIPVDKFSRRLWGDQYFDQEKRTFAKKPSGRGDGGKRTFVEFVLEPLYKIYGVVLGEEQKKIQEILDEFGVYLKPSTFGLDVKPLLKEVCKAIFGSADGVVEMLRNFVPPSQEGTGKKISNHYTGPREGSRIVQSMNDCNSRGPLVIHICKLFPTNDCSAFDALGRVMSGTIRPGERVKVLGESYSPEDEEDSTVATVSSVWIFQGRYRVPISLGKAGNWVLLGGIDSSIVKTATVVHENFNEEDLYTFEPLRFRTTSVMRTAAEPLNPQDLPKMVEGLRKINKSYPLAVTKVEESGEHTILGTGEMYLDCVLRDLREMYSDIEIKVADPVVSFAETVVETSAIKCFAETPNKKNKLTMVAEPLDKGLAEDIESGSVDIAWPKKRLGKYLEEKYEWDLMAARSVWAFGPDTQGPNALLDDTLASEVDKSLVNAIKNSVVQGFQWGVREGPLCDEPLRSVKFKLLDATVAEEAIHRSGGQVIPTARRVTYSSFLTATPRLMEPIYRVEIQTPADCMRAIYNVLTRRRGHVIQETAKPGTPIYIVKAQLPVIESFGFETDLRYHTQGQSFCLSVFDHWHVVPGDPLDKSIVLRPLEPAPVPHLAREFMVKTRRRKGMSEDVTISKFFDDPLLLDLAMEEAGLQVG